MIQQYPQEASAPPSRYEGYVPEFTSLECWDGTLTPLSFGCLKICDIPVVENSLAPCGEGSVLYPGSTCFASCVVGFSPSVDLLRCDPKGSGRLTPLTFTCGRDCETPEIYGAVPFAPCAEFPFRHGRTCTIQCPARSNSEGQVSCFDGELRYAGAVSCRQNCPAPENVPFSITPVCNGATRHGVFCQPRCALAFTAVPDTLQCQDGRLVDPDYFQNFVSTTVTSTTRTFSSRTSTSFTFTSKTSTTSSTSQVSSTTSTRLGLEITSTPLNTTTEMTSTTQFESNGNLSNNTTQAIQDDPSNLTQESPVLPTTTGSSTNTRTTSIPAMTGTVTTSTHTVNTVTLTSFEGAPSFSCMRVPHFQSMSAGLFYTAGVPTGARSLHVHFAGNDGLAVAFTSSGALLVTVGYELAGAWTWGEAATVQSASSQDFLVSLAACHRESFIVGFRSESRPSLRGFLLGPIGLAPAAGCIETINTAPVTELELVSASSSGLWLMYTTDDGIWVRYVYSSSAVEVQVSATASLISGSRHVAGVALLGEPSLLALAYESGSSQPLAYARLLRLNGPEDAAGGYSLGEATLLHRGPLLFPSMVALSDRRIAISFGDGSSQSCAIRLARVGGWDATDLSSDYLDIGESFEFAGFGPSGLQSFGTSGPLFLSASTISRWVHLWGRHLASGTDLTLTTAVGETAPDMQRLRANEVTVLLSSTGDPGAVSKVMLKWPCLLPQDTTGYILSACDAALTPMLEEDCLVSCDVGFVLEGLRPQVRCFPPPAAPIFHFSGCKALPCTAPRGIHNAMSPSCLDGAAIEDGQSCRSACAPGYVPSIPELRCQVGQLEPTSFKCLAECCDNGDTNESTCVAMEPVNLPCAAPLGVGLAQEPSCREGYQIAPGSSCQGLCQAGYIPTIASLHCNVNGTGQLTPSSFQCERQRSNVTENSSKSWSNEIYLVNASVRLDLFPESLETPAAVLVELPSARERIRNELVAGGLKEGLRQAVAAACKSSVQQVTLLSMSNSSAMGSRRLAEVVELLFLGIFEGEENASEAVLQLEELTAGGNAQRLFEAEIRSSWAQVLVASDFPATNAALEASTAVGWISAVKPGSNGWPLSLQVLASSDAMQLPTELQAFVQEAFDSARSIDTNENQGNKGFPYTDGFLDFVPLKVLQDFRILMATRFGSGLAIDVCVSILALGALGLVNSLLALMHYRCWVRRRAALQQGGWDETTFRSVYMIPESHRHHWNPKCRVSSVGTVCCVCFCPCLRIPLTWHRGGVLPYWLGFFSCCIFGPFCWSCLGCKLRMRLGMVFGIPGSIFSRFIQWLCCCCCISIQESLHVDGALRAITEASKASMAAKAEVRSQLQRVPTQEEMEMIDVDEEPPMTTGRFQTFARRASEQMGVIHALRHSGSGNIAAMPNNAEADEDAEGEGNSSSSDTSASTSKSTSSDGESSVSSSKGGGSTAREAAQQSESRL